MLDGGTTRATTRPADGAEAEAGLAADDTAADDTSAASQSTADAAAATQPVTTRTSAGQAVAGLGVLVVLLVGILVVGAWHLTQGTSGAGPADLLRWVLGIDRTSTVGGVPIETIVSGSRLPRLAAGITVGFALGTAGALLQSVSRNPLASPDTLAVTSGAFFAITAVSAFGVSVPFWASGGVAFAGGLLAAGVVLTLSGRAAGTATTRLILAGSAIAMALDALTAMLLILFKEETIGLFAWGSGSLAQLGTTASMRAIPVIVAALLVALLLSRRLDVLGLGDDAASSLGVPVQSTRIIAVVCAVLLSAIAVTVAGPIGFVGLGAPVLARLLATRVPALRGHGLLLAASGLCGALLVLASDAGLRGILGAEAAASIPTGVPTAVLGGVLIVVLALRLREAGSVQRPPSAGSRPRSRGRFVTVVAIAAVLLVAAAVCGLLAGSLWLRLGDIALWIQGTAPDLIAHALDERAPRTAAALCAGAALALAGSVVQSTVRNPLAEPGLLGITAGAGLGGVIVVTLLPWGGRGALILAATLCGLATFALIAVLAARGGLAPDRFVLVGIGCGYALTALTTYLLLRSDPYRTPRIFTWLSGTTYGRQFADVIPVVVVLALALPVLLWLARDLDLLAIDEDTPRILGLRTGRTRLIVLSIAAVLAAVSVVAVGVVGFVGLVAPHLARGLVGSRHARSLPVAVLLGGILVTVADILGRTVVAPQQVPAGLMIALIGAPYFVWLLRRSRG